VWTISGLDDADYERAIAGLRAGDLVRFEDYTLQVTGGRLRVGAPIGWSAQEITWEAARGAMAQVERNLAALGEAVPSFGRLARELPVDLELYEDVERHSYRVATQIDGRLVLDRERQSG